MTVTYHSGRRLQGLDADRTATQLPAGAVGGWVELGRTTLGSSNANISVASLPDKRYYMVLGSHTGFSTNFDITSRYNGDTGGNYAIRVSGNGGTDVTATSRTGDIFSVTSSGSTTPKFHVGYIANRSANEKLSINHGVHQLTAGATTAPERSENVGKWANTSDAIDEIIATSAGAATFNSGSEIVVLGWDPADTHTTNFWQQLANVDLSEGAGNTLDSGTITGKKYLWVQTFVEAAGTHDVYLRPNSDTNPNMSNRSSVNGGTDSTLTSNAIVFGRAGYGTANNAFGNHFIINNTSNEKLCISHWIYPDATGASAAPARVETVSKWTNTTDQITQLELVDNPASGTDLGTGTKMIIWGAD